MKCDRKNLLLYAVTDRFWTGEKTLKEQVEESLTRWGNHASAAGKRIE